MHLSGVRGKGRNRPAGRATAECPTPARYPRSLCLGHSRSRLLFVAGAIRSRRLRICLRGRTARLARRLRRQRPACVCRAWRVRRAVCVPLRRLRRPGRRVRPPVGAPAQDGPVFSQHAENGWGYSEETKPMLETSYGFIPWDDLHHTALSQTNGEDDGRWLFVNGNNTPRVARIDLTHFETTRSSRSPTRRQPRVAVRHGELRVHRLVHALQHPDAEPRRADPSTSSTSRGRSPSSRPTSRGRWTSRSSSSCRASTTTSRARARDRRPAGCSSPRTTPSRPTRCSR
jgi:hypothetical protein